MSFKRAARPHGILWEGRSLIDDAPIVAIATAGSANRKTGPMIQVWIVRSDMAPHVAKRAGLDVSVCGHCAMREACYVVTAHSPRSVWEAYNAGLYQTVAPSAFERSAIRFRPPEGERFDPVEELFFRQSPEREPDLRTNWADNAARSSRAVSGPGERTLRAGCEALVREWSELGEIGLSAKVAGRQLQQLLKAVGEG